MNYLRYFRIGIGTVPIILSCPHGGFLKPSAIPTRTRGVQIPDKNTFIISKQIIERLRSTDINIYHILSKIHRSKIDFNRPPMENIAFEQSSIEAQEIHSTYHNYIQKFSEECVANNNKSLFIDIHGFTKPSKEYPDIIFGHIFGQTLDVIEPSSKINNEEYWGYSQLIHELKKVFSIDDGLGLSNFNIAYSGGYITHKFHRKKNVNAIQLEVAKYIREDHELTRTFVDAFVAAIINCLNS